jgi:hypothetical protein
MTKWILALSVGWLSSVAQARAEIQIFMNYRGPNLYDYKVVSSTENQVSAWYILPDSPNGACFKGNALEALDLFKAMVAIFDAEYQRHIQVETEVVYDPIHRRTGLAIQQVDEDGQLSDWFPYMRECERWSTDKERWPAP